jgi:NAD(P)-dependent dehydrogenase (short-subunit alcohol dehydrogenase family)
VTVLVNAPGLNSSTPFFEIGLDEWHRILDANLTSVFLACQVFGRAMIANGRGGSIINLSSASSGPPLSKVAAYSVAKAGLNNLTQYLARELAPHGIRVNAIAPRNPRPHAVGSTRRARRAHRRGRLAGLRESVGIRHRLDRPRRWRFQRDDDLKEGGSP